MAGREKQNANLKPIKKGDLSKEELKKRQSNGGKKSGEVRRAKRDARQAVRYLLNLPAKGSIAANLKELGIPENEQTNMAALQARLYTMAMGGNLDAYRTLMMMGGFEPEENRKERESIASDRRRDAEVEAKVNALGGSIDGVNIAVNGMDEDGANDVVIYLPKMQTEEECEMDEEDPELEEENDEGESKE